MVCSTYLGTSIQQVTGDSIPGCGSCRSITSEQSRRDLRDRHGGERGGPRNVGIDRFLGGVLALAEESPKVGRALVDPSSPEPDENKRYRIIHVSRLSLLVVAGAAGAEAIGWWERAPLEGLGVVLIAGGFLFMIAEALPRAVGTLAPDVAAAAVPKAARSAALFRPLLAVVTAVERAVRAILPTYRGEGMGLFSAQRDLLLGVFSLSDTTVAEIMTPRLDVVALDHRADWREVVELVRREEHARIPVYTDTLDHVTGCLYAKDLVPAVAGVSAVPGRWQALVRPVQFVPESKALAMQLRDFQRGASHIAVVVDEFGGTSGVVTLEDILEEVVGEIHDEHDPEEPPDIEREGPDKFWIAGRVTIDELSALLETNLEQEEVSTVGGLVYSELGRVPDPGDEFRLGEFRVVVEQVVRRRVRRVYFERLAAPGTGDSQQPR